MPCKKKSLEFYYPEFEVKLEGFKLLHCFGSLKPTARSNSYNFKMVYKIGTRPKVEIIEPNLVTNFKGEKIPHTFKGNVPCLYYKRDFDGSMTVAKTIIPWLITWLYFYEDWHVTGDWNGKGVHPVKNKRPFNSN